MAKAKPTVRDIVAPVLPMDEIKKMSQKDACARFAERATVSQRAFAEMGKLHYAISASLRKGQTIYGELRKLGVKDSTISNASYASKVFDLVAGGKLTEAQYDTFTFNDCHQIVRAMSERSALRLTGEDVAALVAAKPDSFDSELQSIYETGLTVEEAAAQAKAEADRKAAEEAAAKKAAEEKAEREKQEAIAAALAAQAKAKAAPPAPAPVAVTAAAAPTVPAAPVPAAPPTAAAPAAPVNTPTAPVVMAAPIPAPAAPAPVRTAPAPSAIVEPEAEDEPEGDSAEVPPANVTSLPADPDASVPDVLAALDEIAVAAASFSEEGRKAIFTKFNECMELLSETLASAKAA